MIDYGVAIFTYLQVLIVDFRRAAYHPLDQRLCYFNCKAFLA